MTDTEEREATDGSTRRTRAPRSRASGESSIFKGEDGRWHGFVSMGKKDNGRRDRRHVSGAKRADVVTKVRAIETKRDAGMVEAAGRAPTVGEWLDHWLEHIAARRVRARTLESYESTVRLHLRPGVGHQRLDRLQPEHLERLYAALADKGLGPASILRAHRVLSRALKVASQRGKVARNVATLVDSPVVEATGDRHAVRAPRRSRGDGRGPGASQRRQVDRGDGRRPPPIGGARPALGRRRPRARNAHGSPRRPPASAGRGLSTRSPRPIAAAAPSRCRHRWSRRYMPTVRPSSKSASPPARSGQNLDLVFAQPNGKAIERKSDWRAWKSLLHEAGVRDIRLHDGRHTAATLLLSEGVHPRVVMEVLGHAQMRTTTDTYSHVMPALGRDAADRMGRALWD